MPNKDDPKNWPGLTIEAQRRGLLAKVHIARNQLGLDEETYREILRNAFGVETAADLAVPDLERLVAMFKNLGWVPQRLYRDDRRPKDTQLIALRQRITAVTAAVDNGRSRLSGLSRKICGVDNPAWCGDPERLKGLLAALTKIAGEKGG